ncbi:hypothetical protein MRB53_004941 [Persea americana]|uniref:Uncharacterized protein n=1 Tax=Persea americana TaxID=3435 RepID=A0ACC2MC64_PERAE|nr:hypothetical protein MRB53_004941 [Persea americana]
MATQTASVESVRFAIGYSRIRPLTHLHFFFLFFSRICNSYSIFRGFWSESILRRLITSLFFPFKWPL